jgi:prolyl-tRNA synthetase
MKDLYTFDYSILEAMKTYNAVRDVYSSFFDDLKIPYLVAEADSGNMGGSLSHEYHIPSAKGEDIVISCSSCDYVANEELAEGATNAKPAIEPPSIENSNKAAATNQRFAFMDVKTWSGLTQDGLTLVNVHYPRRKNPDQDGSEPDKTPGTSSEINLHLLRTLIPNIDLANLGTSRSWHAKLAARQQGAESSQLKLVNIFDYRIPLAFRKDALSQTDHSNISVQSLEVHPTTGQALNMHRIEAGDACPRCEHGILKTTTAIELGHTFFLGTRYSSIFDAKVAVDPHLLPSTSDSREVAHMEEVVGVRKTSLKELKPSTSTTAVVPLQMGCHGIGVSRMIAAVADNLADSKGLNWPRLIAPFEVVVVPGPGLEEETTRIYDNLIGFPDGCIDAILDDRDKELPWKLSDADLIGYPVIVLLGKGWRKHGTCEVQCRRLGLKEFVKPNDLPAYVESLLKRL